MNPKKLEEYTRFMEEMMPLTQEEEEQVHFDTPFILDDFLTFNREPPKLANAQTEISNGNRRATGTLQQLDVGNSTVEVQGKGSQSFLRIVNSNTQNIKLAKKPLQERPGSDANLYSCSFCRNSYQTYKTMKTHERACWRQSNQTPLKDRQCKECHKVFSSATSLKEHMKMHSCIQPFRCDRCVRKFYDERLYAAHMDWHKRQDEVDARCNALSVEKHLVVKVFNCVFCKENFTAIFNVGQAKRRFTCDACLHKYNNSAETLSEEVKRKSQEEAQQRDISCNRCGRQYVFRGFLARHQPTCDGTLKRVHRKR